MGKVEKSFDVINVFNTIINYIFKLILVFLILGLIIGTGKLFLSFGDLLQNRDITGSYKTMITDVLTLYILIEIARIFVEYFNTNRLRMTYLVDAAIAFILRDILIMLYSKDYQIGLLYALTLLLLVLGLMRVAFISLFQREIKMNLQIEKK